MLRSLFGIGVPPGSLNCSQLLAQKSSSNNWIPLIQQQVREMKRRPKKIKVRDTIYERRIPHPKTREVVDYKLFDDQEPIRSAKKFGDIEEGHRKFDFNLQSLNARGFLRFQKGYDPPDNAAEKIMSLIISSESKLQGMSASELLDYKITDSHLKYTILSKASQEFNHAVPNSLLYLMETIGNIAKFYTTRVNINTPYEELIRSKDLPTNLHIQNDYVRFTGDPNFKGGLSPFPKSKTVYTGIYSKKKFGVERK